MNKNICHFFSLITVFFLLGCSFGVKEKSFGSNTPNRTGDLSSISVNEVFTDENGDQWVKLKMNSLNSLIKNYRTVMPDNPELYFSVTGSTSFADGAGPTADTWDDIEDADCSAAKSIETGEVVVTPFYAEDVNITDNITLVLKVKKLYYLTAYGTSKSPAVISQEKVSDSKDHTKDSIYGDKSSGTFQDYDPGIDEYNTDNEHTYYAVREKIIEGLKEDAVIKGTVAIYVDIDNSGNVIFRENSSTGNEIANIVIPASTKGIDGAGQPVIIIDLPDTASDTTLAESSRTIKAVEVKWTPRDAAGISGSFVYDVSTLGGKKIEFKPYVAVGTYDLDISFLNTEASEHATKKNDVFALHDVLTVWKNQKSKILGTSSFYSGTELVQASEVDAVFDGTEADSQTADTVQTMSAGTSFLGTDADDYKSKYYTFTVNDVIKFQRTVFYVSGTGPTLPTATGTPDGSLFNPFATVQDAVNAIIVQRAALYDSASAAGNDATDWNIVLDGAEATPAEVSFTNIAATYEGIVLPSDLGGNTVTCDAAQAASAAAKGMNLTIRAFKSANRATLSKNVTFVNANNGASDGLDALGSYAASSDGVRLYLVNFDWNGEADANKFELGADCYLSNSSICSDLTTHAPGTGYVQLNAAQTDVTGNGVFYMDSTDATSTVKNIVVSDGNTPSSGGYGHTVLNYLYHPVNTDVSGTIADFRSVIVADPDAKDFSSNAAEYSETTRFAVQGAGSAVTGNYYNSDDRALTQGLKKVLDVDTEVGSSSYGCIIVKSKDTSVKTTFDAGNYTGTISMTPVVLTKTDIASGDAALRTITGTLTVKSQDPVTYPANDTFVINALKQEASVTDGKGNSDLTDGSMIIYLAESEDENSNVAAEANSWITANYITAVASGDETEATYQFSVVLNELFANTNADNYYLRVYFELGTPSMATSPTPFSETFRISITD